MGTASKASGTSEPPRWTYVVGSVLAIVGMAWAILTYFLPKPATDKSPTRSDVQVSVSGSGSVGVGEMKGGQIIVSPLRQVPRAASPKEASTPTP
jgi:hypothetical protein